MRRAHKHNPSRTRDYAFQTRFVRLQGDKQSLLSNQTAEAVGNEEERALGLVRSTIGDSVGKRLSVPAKAVPTRVLLEAHNVSIVAVADDPRRRKLRTDKVGCEGAVGVRPRRLAIAGQAMNEPYATTLAN
jgi:hypothetical protein